MAQQGPKGNPGTISIRLRMNLPFDLRTVEGAECIDCSIRIPYHARRLKEIIEAKGGSFHTEFHPIVVKDGSQKKRGYHRRLSHSIVLPSEDDDEQEVLNYLPSRNLSNQEGSILISPRSSSPVKKMKRGDKHPNSSYVR